MCFRRFRPYKLWQDYLCNGIQELRKTLALFLEGHAKCSSTGRVG